MKYAFMSSSAPEASLDQLLAMADDWGYAGIEPRIEWGHGHGVEPTASAAERDAIRSTVDGSSVELCCVATGCTLAEPSTAKAEREKAALCIDLAADVGCGGLRVFGGNFDNSVDRAAAAATLVESLKSLADQAAARGVTLLLETHDAWTNPEAVADVVERVGRDTVGVLWDVLHPMRVDGWSIEAAFQALKPWVRHVHIHDATLARDRLDFRPIGEGEIDHKRIVELLHGDGFDGFLSGEWINWQPPAEHLPREVRTLRRYEAELGIAAG